MKQNFRAQQKKSHKILLQNKEGKRSCIPETKKNLHVNTTI